jgi:acyl-CoA thioester hydrolase
MAFRHELRVRYAECDMQRVVFNAHYLAYVDDAMSAWLRHAGWAYDGLGWDFMTRHADVEWVGSATYGDVVAVDCEVERWGTTSFTVRYRVGVVGGAEEVAVVRATYVGIDPETRTKSPVPEAFRAALDA